MRDSMKIAAKKMAALIAASAMAVAPVAGTIGMTSVTAMAAMTGTQPSATDTGTVTISGVEPGATVKLYKIVEANIDEGGYHGWQATASAGTTNVSEQTATDGTKSWKANVSALMTLINSGSGADGKAWSPAYSTTANTVTKGTAAATDKTVSYTATVAPGEYLVVVEPSGRFEKAYIYSPMLVSLFYKESTNGFELSSADESTVAATGSMTNDAGSAVYAKRSQVTLTKKITNPDGVQGLKTEDNDVKDKSVTGDDLQVGDTQTFTITTAIPDYNGYTNLNEDKLTFKLEDNQDAGFNKPTSDPVVTVTTGSGETAQSNVLTKDKDYTLEYGKFSSCAVAND